MKRLYEVLDKIDDRGRMAFVLRHLEGYELTEVAEALGCSLATTKRAPREGAGPRERDGEARPAPRAVRARGRTTAQATTEAGEEVGDAAQGD